jgi:hypothetical protein
MKVKYKLTDRKKYAKLEKDFYDVLVYGEFDQNSKIFLIVNDNLEIIEPDESVLEIIDNDLSEYVQRNELNFDRVLYLDTSLSKFMSNFKNYSQLKLDDIWSRGKLSNFFFENNYDIPENYQNTVLNKSYKLNLIEGFLMFANNYINNKNEACYWDELRFYTVDSFDNIIGDRFKDRMKINPLEITEYETLLYNFISKYLFDQTENEEKSIELCHKLFKLIDSIFINDINKIFIIETFYDEVFSIEYENRYYCLSKSWGS